MHDSSCHLLGDDSHSEAGLEHHAVSIKKLRKASRDGLLTKSWLLEYFINPFTPLFICDYHFGATKRGLPSVPMNLNILNLSNIHQLHENDIVCCETVAFESFVSSILTKIEVPVILFTYRFLLPQIKRGAATEAVRTHPMIRFWFSQNPVYKADSRYSGFPYGIREDNLLEYASAFLRSWNERNKTFLLTNVPLNKNTHRFRRELPSIPRMPSSQYYDLIAASKYVVSPAGDRPDTYRHYECIGLGSIPIANINETLYSFFGKNMMFMSESDILQSVISPSVGMLNSKVYVDRSFVLSDTWVSRVMMVKNAQLHATKASRDSGNYKLSRLIQLVPWHGSLH